MIGRNCIICRRWIPGFVLRDRPSPTCSDGCHRRWELQLESLAAFLSPPGQNFVAKNKPKKPRGPRPPVTELRCGACGELGHIAVNRKKCGARRVGTG
jgi:hypothetical protein